MCGFSTPVAGRLVVEVLRSDDSARLGVVTLCIYIFEVPEKLAGLKLQQLQVENLLSIWCVPIVEDFEGNYHGSGDGNDDEADVVSCGCATAF